MKKPEKVQAEIHHRKRKTFTSITILLHSMRLTAILDWWEALKDFLVLNSPEPEPINNNDSFEVDAFAITSQDNMDKAQSIEIPFDLKLKITDSELVLVEDTSMWNTNAVILKSTTILLYKSNLMDAEKPMTWYLPHCEVFSCILGLEYETAFSIIDPVGESIKLTQVKFLEMHMQSLNVKLSYNDMNIFSKFLNFCHWKRRTS